MVAVGYRVFLSTSSTSTILVQPIIINLHMFKPQIYVIVKNLSCEYVNVSFSQNCIKIQLVISGELEEDRKKKKNKFFNSCFFSVLSVTCSHRSGSSGGCWSRARASRPMCTRTCSCATSSTSSLSYSASRPSGWLVHYILYCIVARHSIQRYSSLRSGSSDVYAYMFLCDFFNFIVVTFGIAVFGVITASRSTV